MAGLMLTSIQPHELLEVLMMDPAIARYRLNICFPDSSFTECYLSRVQPCGTMERQMLCGKLCEEPCENALKQALREKRAVAFRCPIGLIGFVIPVVTDGATPYCLVGGGLREKNLNLSAIEEIARTSDIDPFAFLDQLGALVTASVPEAEEEAGKIRERAHSLLQKNVHTLILARTMQKLNSITSVVRELERLESTEEIVALLGETLWVLFNFDRMAVILPAPKGDFFQVARSWNVEVPAERIPTEKLQRHLLPPPYRQVFLHDEEIQGLFPGTTASTAACMPLAIGATLTGVLLLFDATINSRDQLLLELLAGRAAAALVKLREGGERAQEAAHSKRLLSLIDELSLIEHRDDLFREIITMATELVKATAGSLMMLDESEGTLRIETIKGMNPELARSMTVRIGEGIAGRVAQNGQPLLVNDIERDSRVSQANRPRFKTKSFVSLPLKLHDKVIGVLNLADKEGNDIFTDTDLQLLATFVRHVSAMIGRNEIIERSRQLEQLSVTDPLTGLYNRRFLIRRLEEEISRSTRFGLSFTILLVDLDNFKMYNDLCGHTSGDLALKKTAQILRASARKMDIVSRYGGEEFCIILPNSSPKESRFVAERVRHEIEKEPFPQEEHLPLGCFTASIGIASFPEGGDTITALIDAADSALYQAKAEGRNRIVIFNPTVRSKIVPLQNQANIQ